jgi:TPR repeat protein
MDYRYHCIAGSTSVDERRNAAYALSLDLAIGLHGKGSDHEQQLFYALLAAQWGHMEAQYQVGILYLLGAANLILPDIHAAHRWLQMAADQGHKGALTLIETNSI